MGVRAGSLPVLLVVDVEPDERHPVPGSEAAWEGFELAWRLLAELRAGLAAATGEPALLCWYLRLDPQIEAVHGDPAWIVDRYRERFDVAGDLGDELGIHPHAHRWSADRGAWCIDHGDADWVRHCLESSLDVYETVFGRPCCSHRYGDRFFSQRIADTLQRRSVHFDLTLEPGRPELRGLIAGEIGTGAIPDMTGCPRTPYHPAREEYRMRGDDPRALWMVPLTTVALPSLLGAAARALRTRRGTGLEDPAVHNLSLGHRPRLFRYLLGRALASRPSHLALVLRTGDLVKPGVLARSRRNAASLVRVARQRPLRFTNPAGAVAGLAG